MKKSVPDILHPNAFLDHLREHTPDVVKDNAPRIVAGLKLVGVSTALFSDNRTLNVSGAGFISAFGTMAMFGHRKSEAEKAELRAEDKRNPHSTNPVVNFLHKAVQPYNYPLESSAMLSMGSGVLWSASGLTGNDGISVARLLGGALSVAADANIALSEEDTSGAHNPHAQGSIPYYITKLRHRPVLVSSVLNASSDLAQIGFGAYEHFAKGKEMTSFVAGSLLIAANIFQSI